MVLVPYTLFIFLELLILIMPGLGLATILRLFHAGRRAIPAMRGEPDDDRGVYSRVVL